MKYTKTSLVTLLLMLLALSAVRADDATPEPGTPQENECNPGGALYRAENQDGCPNEWYWKAGWYLAAVNNGRISRDDMPDEFKSVLPPEETIDLGEPAIGSCWGYPYSGFAIKYIGPANTLNNIDGYFEPTCTVDNGSDYNGTALVFAKSQSDAEAICATLGIFNAVYPLSAYAPNTPSNAYMCWINGT